MGLSNRMDSLFLLSQCTILYLYRIQNQLAMENDFEHLNEEDRLDVENTFLKMKLMTENGALFNIGRLDGNKSEIPPDIEMQFLKYIIEFENQSQNKERITIFDKINQPNFFIPVNEVPDSQIEEECLKLLNYLHLFNIRLHVCSPNISDREIYRFIIEELFNEEIDNISMPGMFINFTYDEFHPDAVYDNSNIAITQIKEILGRGEMEWMDEYDTEKLRLNSYENLNQEAFKNRILGFHLLHKSTKVENINVLDCTVNESTCTVNGNVWFSSGIDNFATSFLLEWRVDLKNIEDFNFWVIHGVGIDGLSF